MLPYEEQSTCFLVPLPASACPTTQFHSGPCEVSSLTTLWSKLSHKIRSGVRTSTCEGWKPYQEGVSPIPTALVGKNIPFISHLSDLAQALHTALSHSSTGTAAMWAEPQGSCLCCVWVLLSFSSLCPGPSERDIKIRWSIMILLAVTRLFRT